MGNKYLKAIDNSIRAKPMPQVCSAKVQRLHAGAQQHPMMLMQQTVGNQALIQMLRAKTIQAKLTVGQPNDIYEQEADRVADQVMRMPDPALQCGPLLEDEDKQKLRGKILAPGAGALQTKAIREEDALHAKAASGAVPELDPGVEDRIQNLRGGGQPLPESVRNYFEPRFGYDFSQVQVHHNSQAAASAQAVHAKAFTLGNDMVFGSGQYAPEGSEGKRLIAHELTHVIQQNNSLPMVSREPLSSFERAEIQQAQNNPTNPIEVTVIDDSDIVGWAAAFTRTGEVYMTNVTTMVDNVLRATGGTHPIYRLNIIDHGNSSGIQIGNDWITPANLTTFSAQLSRLRGHFTSSGFVHIQHCEIGQNLDFIRQLSAIFGVPVYAGTGAHNPVYRFNFGDYVRCNPDGTCQENVGRP